MNKHHLMMWRFFITAGLLMATGVFSFAPVLAINTKVCDVNIVKFEKGFYGQYYNMSEDDPGMQSEARNYSQLGIGPENYWYSDEYFSFSRVEENINFGNNFFPLNENKKGDPFHFAVYWHAAIRVAENGTYDFNLRSDDDSWLFINDDLIIDLGGAHRALRKTKAIELEKGLYEIRIYFSERSRNNSVFSFTVTNDENLSFVPLAPGCALNDVPATPNNQTRHNNSGGHNSGGRVLGASTLDYTPAIALYKTATSPDVYAIYANGQKHYISSPTAFLRYGYNFTDIKIVPAETLAQYPEARLLRTPEDATVNHLYTRPNRQWLRIAIPSPTAFVSYPNNFWGNVIIVDELDIIAYPEAKLIKTQNNSGVYLLQNGEKRLFLNGKVFESLGYSWSEIVTVSVEHLNAYTLGDPIG